MGVTQPVTYSFVHCTHLWLRRQCPKPTKYETDVDVSPSLKPKMTSPSKQNERLFLMPSSRKEGATDWFTCWKHRAFSFGTDILASPVRRKRGKNGRRGRAAWRCRTNFHSFIFCSAIHQSHPNPRKKEENEPTNYVIVK